MSRDVMTGAGAFALVYALRPRRAALLATIENPLNQTALQSMKMHCGASAAPAKDWQSAFYAQLTSYGAKLGFYEPMHQPKFSGRCLRAFLREWIAAAEYALILDPFAYGGIAGVSGFKLPGGLGGEAVMPFDSDVTSAKKAVSAHLDDLIFLSEVPPAQLEEAIASVGTLATRLQSAGVAFPYAEEEARQALGRTLTDPGEYAGAAAKLAVGIARGVVGTLLSPVGLVLGGVVAYKVLT